MNEYHLVQWVSFTREYIKFTSTRASLTWRCADTRMQCHKITNRCKQYDVLRKHYAWKNVEGNFSRTIKLNVWENQIHFFMATVSYEDGCNRIQQINYTSCEEMASEKWTRFHGIAKAFRGTCCTNKFVV